MITRPNIVVRLARTPPPGPLPADIFDYAEEAAPEPREGECTLEILYQTIDAGSRGSLDPHAGYVVRIAPGDRLFSSGTLGRVFASRHADYPEGALVAFDGGVRQTFHRVNPARHRGVRLVDPADGPIDMHIGLLGQVGFTAWIGVKDICRPVAGETVLVSAAAGAVGSAAGQFARLLGARTVGIAGGPEKCAFARDGFGFDACVDYRGEDFASALAQACPNGVDSYFENVGGAVQAAAFPLLNAFGRVALCGLVSQYAGSGPAPAPNLMFAIDKRIELRGFLSSDHYDRMPEFRHEAGGWFREGRLRHRNHVVQGVEQLHEAINALVAGRNVGQTVHQLATA